MPQVIRLKMSEFKWSSNCKPNRSSYFTLWTSPRLLRAEGAEGAEGALHCDAWWTCIAYRFAINLILSSTIDAIQKWSKLMNRFLMKIWILLILIFFITTFLPIRPIKSILLILSLSPTTSSCSPCYLVDKWTVSLPVRFAGIFLEFLFKIADCESLFWTSQQVTKLLSFSWPTAVTAVLWIVSSE